MSVSVSKVCESMSMSVSVWKLKVCACLSLLRAFGILICEKNVETLRPGRGVFIQISPQSHDKGQ